MLCDSRLKCTNCCICYSQQCEKCKRFSCSEHLYLTDEFYERIVLTLLSAAKSIIRTFCNARKQIRKVFGCNYRVRESHESAKHYYKCWIVCDRQRAGEIYNNMSNSRIAFKNKFMCCQNNKEMIRMDILTTHRAYKNFIKFWKDTKKLNPKTSVPLVWKGYITPNIFSDIETLVLISAILQFT